MNFNGLITASSKETIAFVKKNAKKFAVLGELQTARDGCSLRESFVLIQGLITPMEKELRKECESYDKKMSGIWKPAKGEKVPKEAQKELDKVLKKSADTIKSQSGKKVNYNSNPMQGQWIQIMSISG